MILLEGRLATLALGVKLSIFYLYFRAAHGDVVTQRPRARTSYVCAAREHALGGDPLRQGAQGAGELVGSGVGGVVDPIDGRATEFEANAEDAIGCGAAINNADRKLRSSFFRGHERLFIGLPGPFREHLSAVRAYIFCASFFRWPRLAQARKINRNFYGNAFFYSSAKGHERQISGKSLGWFFADELAGGGSWSRCVQCPAFSNLARGGAHFMNAFLLVHGLIRLAHEFGERRWTSRIEASHADADGQPIRRFFVGGFA